MVREKKAFKLQETFDGDSTVTEFIKETDNCAISMFSENSFMQMGSRGGALKFVTNQPASKGNLRAECEPCRTVVFVSPSILLLLLLLHVTLKWTLSYIKATQIVCGNIKGGLEEIRTGGIHLRPMPCSRIFLTERPINK